VAFSLMAQFGAGESQKDELAMACCIRQPPRGPAAFRGAVAQGDDGDLLATRASDAD
jgi:hypothetical protein